MCELKKQFYNGTIQMRFIISSHQFNLNYFLRSYAMNAFQEFIQDIQNNSTLSEQDKLQVLKNAEKLKSEKVHVLITGATGCGKSSTINALFGVEVAKVGQGSNPETMEIARYDLGNVVLFDSPGLGDGYDADLRHAKNITNKLLEKDKNDNLLIDLVLVILDGSSRDLGTSYELINKVIIPNLGEDKSRLLVAINQADMAMKGRHWDYENNQPEPKLIEFLDEKVASTKARIKEATGVDTQPIYYAAGFKDGSDEQLPWNLAKLLSYVLSHTSEKKRIVFAKEINQNQEVWAKNDDLKDYQKEVKDSFLESLLRTLSDGISDGIDQISKGVERIFDTGKELVKTVAKGFQWVKSWFN